MYQLILVNTDTEQELVRNYGDEFFNLSNDDLAMNILGMYEAVKTENHNVFDETLPPDTEALGHEIDMEVLPPEGSPEHPQYLSDEEKEENREAIKNL